MHIIGLKNCDSTRKARKWLNERNIEIPFSDISEEPFTEEELDELIRKVGLSTLINKRSRTWRDLGLAKSDPSEKELRQAALSNPKLIKRPILVLGESVVVGFDEDTYQNLAESMELI
ncbi:MAG: arsenate reductase family protein [Bacteroidota bacterium]